MTSRNRGPAVARRQLRRKLREARQNAKKTQADVSNGLDWSPSKVIRVENAQVAVATSDIMALSSFFGVPRAGQVELIELARLARKASPNTTYRDVLTDEFADWLEHEEYASQIRQFETKLVPGVLQTYDYADSIVRALLGPGERDDEKKVGRIVSARMDRSDQLTGADGPPLKFVLDETVIRRGVGNERGSSTYSIMIEQLLRLKELNTRGRRILGEQIEPSLNPDIEIQIIPLDFGAYQALRGPFELLEFDELDDDNMIYFEEPHGDVVIRDTHSETAPYAEMFDEMQRLAPKCTATGSMIDQAIELINERQNSVYRPSNDQEPPL